MKIHQKHLVPGIVVFILIFMLSFASGQTQIKRTGTIFQQASIKNVENQDAPIEVIFEENKKGKNLSNLTKNLFVIIRESR